MGVTLSVCHLYEMLSEHLRSPDGDPLFLGDVMIVSEDVGVLSFAQVCTDGAPAGLWKVSVSKRGSLHPEIEAASASSSCQGSEQVAEGTMWFLSFLSPFFELLRSCHFSFLSHSEVK